MARRKMERFTLSDTARRILTRSALIGGISIASIALVSFGLYKVCKYVDHNVAYSNEPPKVVLKNRPAWMSDLVAEQICTAARPSGAHSALDNRMLRDAKAMLENNLRTNAWIKQIHQLKLVYGQRPGDTMMLDCEFRVPVALIHYKDAYYLVDGEGYALPERYPADQVARVIFGTDGRMNIRVVEGIHGDRPMPGQKWEGDDLAAALDMIKLLHGRQYAEEIVKVDVSNYAGRQDSREAQLVLVTRQNTQIRWGRATFQHRHRRSLFDSETAATAEDLHTVQACGRRPAVDRHPQRRHDAPAPGRCHRHRQRTMTQPQQRSEVSGQAAARSPAIALIVWTTGQLILLAAIWADLHLSANPSHTAGQLGTHFLLAGQFILSAAPAGRYRQISPACGRQFRPRLSRHATGRLEMRRARFGITARFGHPAALARRAIVLDAPCPQPPNPAPDRGHAHVLDSRHAPALVHPRRVCSRQHHAGADRDDIAGDTRRPCISVALGHRHPHCHRRYRSRHRPSACCLPR